MKHATVMEFAAVKELQVVTGNARVPTSIMGTLATFVALEAILATVMGHAIAMGNARAIQCPMGVTQGRAVKRFV